MGPAALSIRIASWTTSLQIWQRREFAVAWPTVARARANLKALLALRVGGLSSRIPPWTVLSLHSLPQESMFAWQMAQDHTCSTLFHSSTKSSSSGTKKVGVKCAAGFRAWPGALRTIGDATLRCSRATVIGHDQDGLQRSQPRRMREFAAKHSQFQEPVSTTSFPSHCDSLSSEPKIQTPPPRTSTLQKVQWLTALAC